MFTGIIEEVGVVHSLYKEGENLILKCRSDLTHELQIDQSVSHNGACLTVVNIEKDVYTVVVIKETLEKTNLSDLRKFDKVNLERSMKLSDRVDGHIVQGHVDGKAVCTKIVENAGSWHFYFKHDGDRSLIVKKGSICVNGVSLTIVDAKKDIFSVAIIPYTYENTNFYKIKIGDSLNLEYDILGKYINQNLINRGL